jgi:hypothetical protein
LSGRCSSVGGGGSPCGPAGIRRKAQCDETNTITWNRRQDDRKQGGTSAGMRGFIDEIVHVGWIIMHHLKGRILDDSHSFGNFRFLVILRTGKS